MLKFVELLKTGYGTLSENGQFFMLFMVSLLLLWLSKEFKKKEFRRIATVMLLLLLCPVSAWLLLFYQIQLYGYESMWTPLPVVLLPMTPVLACAAVMAVSRMVAQYTARQGRLRKTVSGKQERVCEMSAVAVLALLLFFSGTLTPAGSMAEEDYDGDKLPKEAAEVLALLEIPAGEDILLLAPDEVAAWARIYSGNIRLPYGRDLWEPELSAYTYDVYVGDMADLHNWVNYMPVESSADVMWEEDLLLHSCAAAGYDYLVFPLQRDDALQSAVGNRSEYICVARTEAYVIYRLSV